MGERQGSGPGARRRPTLTEQARHEQLVEVTVELVADRGYGGATLSAIAERAGITKAAVLYHFASKDDLVRAAYQHVLDALVGRVGAAVEAADAADRPGAYVRSMIGHLREHPTHVRMITEALGHGEGGHAPETRWEPLAAILADARRARHAGEGDDRTLAIALGGAIDAVVAERLHDPAYDTAAAAEELVRMVERALSA
ncbi:TetR/AcrR family transcriptional regulator [Cellulosimicrobium cellulans]|uniref:TetR/AcrR family transcriptional regulator n=1 Tax=Cellulosimicrobium cellulans TaxID=1710 RepID=UPI00084927B7|nr:TetR/AcrR family transcriptional regulator [Cellulosimicrobium cellulans]